MTITYQIMTVCERCLNGLGQEGIVYHQCKKCMKFVGPCCIAPRYNTRDSVTVTFCKVCARSHDSRWVEIPTSTE